MRGGAVCSYFDVQLLLSFVLISLFSSSSHLFLFRCSAPLYSRLFLFRCSAPPLICSYFDVQLLFTLVCSSLVVQLQELNNEIRANETKEELNI
jgi:hypothetical protein